MESKKTKNKRQTNQTHRKRDQICGIYLQWNITQPKKEQNFAICNKMDGPWGYYAKWNKLDKERQILYDITYMWNLKNKTNEQI